MNATCVANAGKLAILGSHHVSPRYLPCPSTNRDRRKRKHETAWMAAVFSLLYARGKALGAHLRIGCGRGRAVPGEMSTCAAAEAVVVRWLAAVRCNVTGLAAVVAGLRPTPTGGRGGALAGGLRRCAVPREMAGLATSVAVSLRTGAPTAARGTSAGWRTGRVTIPGQMAWLSALVAVAVAGAASAGFASARRTVAGKVTRPSAVEARSTVAAVSHSYSMGQEQTILDGPLR